MAYSVYALLGYEIALRQRMILFPGAVVIPLRQGIAMTPITKPLVEGLGEEQPGIEVPAGFYKLTPSLLLTAQTISIKTPVAYIEAEYFGGVGEQSAMVWDQGRVVLGPLVATSDAINAVLRFFKVKVGDCVDEFEAVGLGKHRSNQGWLEEIP
jgi:hypothetical protein